MVTVSQDEFAGMGPSFFDELQQKQSEKEDSVLAAAMDVLANPEIHNPERAKKPKAKVFSRTYDLSCRKDRESYEKILAQLLSNEQGHLLLLDRPPKQFVQYPEGTKYIAYLEWAEFESDEPDAKKQIKPCASKPPAVNSAQSTQENQTCPS